MIKILKLLFIIVSMFSIEPLFAVYMWHEDFDELVNSQPIKKRKIIIDFKKIKPINNFNIDSFKVDYLTDRIQSRVEVSELSGYKKAKLEIHFRNIYNDWHVAHVCTAMKNLNYKKYSSTDPTIFFNIHEHADNDTKELIKSKNEEYLGNGLI